MCHHLRRGVGLLEEFGEGIVAWLSTIGDSPSAQRVACSLWLHKLSITGGYLVKTTLVEGV